MDDIDTYKLKGGRWTIPKDPDDEAYYGVDLSKLLPVGATLVSDPEPPEAIVTGVTVLETPAIAGTFIVAKLGGLNTSEDAEPDDNCCTFRFYISTGERFDRSIYFTRKDK